MIYSPLAGRHPISPAYERAGLPEPRTLFGASGIFLQCVNYTRTRFPQNSEALGNNGCRELHICRAWSPRTHADAGRFLRTTNRQVRNAGRVQRHGKPLRDDQVGPLPSLPRFLWRHTFGCQGLCDSSRGDGMKRAHASRASVAVWSGMTVHLVRLRHVLPNIVTVFAICAGPHPYAWNSTVTWRRAYISFC